MSKRYCPCIPIRKSRLAGLGDNIASVIGKMTYSNATATKGGFYFYRFELD